MDDKGNTGDTCTCIASVNTDDGTRALEQTTAALSLQSSSTRPPDPSSTTSANHPFRHYSNSHHTEVRRSSDDREEDLLLESESVKDRDRQPREDDGSSYFNAIEEPPVQPASLETFNYLPTEVSSYGQLEELVEHEQPFAQPTGNTTILGTTIPLQESCGIYAAQNSELVSRAGRPDCWDEQRFCRNLESGPGSPKLCEMFLFKRGIIARDDLIHALYIIPADDFQKKFPKIKQYEAVVCHGTEFPMVEERQIPSSSLFHHIVIDGICKIHFELVNGEAFTIVSRPMTITNVSEICSRCKDRIGCGFSVTVLTRCTGGKDKLFMDNVRMTIQYADTTLHYIFPIAYYEANISPWLYNSQEVTAMPDEDREVLRSCHVSLLENIGDVISVCEHLYQHKILESDDLEEVRRINKKRDRNAHVLRTIQTRGNVLDLVIDIMRGKRENQEAAAILQRKRFHVTDR